MAGGLRQCCAAVLCGSGGSGGSVAAVLRQVYSGSVCAGAFIQRP